ncbi:NAD(P)/FAD-dependent oxidoreductase [Mycoplasmopsis pulmonis]|uniref:NAD(P)/FAD-dependent oxidoreductase n=1 Tax=Mycoplasmopsis pulmonis TaxID=2107 RepID=UPI002ACD7188|nr:FAD-dependent oxidoreductase [Mycoplasmopsis pulmonis]MDZ7293434.1 FAD-dependent oxidoreductase [Mycoplasmopsis pulmonis]
MSQNKIYDVAIIGAGPGALTAAIYTSRGNLDTVFIDNAAPGGKLIYASKIENWPGDTIVKGTDLAIRFFEHAQAFGAKYEYGKVVDLINIKDDLKELVLEDGKKIQAKSVIIASGMVSRKPREILNYDDFENRGVSYCVICDGPMYGHNPAIIIGGGNSAVEEGTFLSSIASKVYVIVRDSDFIAEKALVNDLKSRKNIEVLFNASVKELHGKDALEYAIVNHNGKEVKLEVASLFPYIGFLPSAEYAKNAGVLEPNGFIKTDEFMETKVPGIYAIGDIRIKDIRQILTATSDGTIAGKILTNRIKK